MAILTQEEAKRIIDKVLSFAKADETSVSISGGKTGNIRYARNTVNTSGESNEIMLSVTSVYGKKSGSTSINELDDESLRKAVERSEEIARLAPETPNICPCLGRRITRAPIPLPKACIPLIRNSAPKLPPTVLYQAVKKTLLQRDT